jgi:hypothetical protein
MENQLQHVLLYEDSMIVLESIKYSLDQAEISCIIKNNSESARLAGFYAGNNNNQLFVYEPDIHSAKKILNDFLSKKN